MCYLARYSCRGGKKKSPKQQPQHLGWLIYQDCYSNFKFMLFKLKSVCLPAFLFSDVFPKVVIISKMCIKSERCPSSSAAPAACWLLLVFQYHGLSHQNCSLEAIYSDVNNDSSLLCPLCRWIHRLWPFLDTGDFLPSLVEVGKA